MEELFRKTVEFEGIIQTVLVVEYKGFLTTIEKRGYKSTTGKRYSYEIAEYYAYSNIDVDIIEALKCFYEEPANVPSDFEFNHP